MKQSKHIFTAAIMLMLLLAILPAAHADMLYDGPDAIQAGSYLEHLVATVGLGSEVSYMEGTLPAGIALETEESFAGLNIYLRGTPLYAGTYNCILNLGESGSMSCPLTIMPASPIFLNVSSDVVCYLDEWVELQAEAYTPDSGMLSYQWYYSSSGQNSNGSVIGGGEAPTLSVGGAYPGTSYYYCLVTNTNNGMTTQAISPAITVSVVENSISSVSILSLPYQTAYTVGDLLDTNGLQLSVSYANGSTETLGSGFTVVPTQFSIAGTQTVEVNYQGYLCYFDVDVQEQPEIVTGIGVLTLPNKTRYTVGENLDTTGLSIRAYTNFGYHDVNSGLSCSPIVLNQIGEQEIYVSYSDKICTFTVVVEEAEQITSLMVDTMPYKTTYSVGQSLDISGLVLKQITNRQNNQLVYSGFTCTPTQLNTVGRQVITVYYGNLSTSFTVTVTDVMPTASPTPIPTALPTAVPTVVPGSVPTITPGSVSNTIPSVAPSVLPTASPAITSSRSTGPSSHQSNLGRTLIGVIVITALVALAVLGAYVFIMNQGGFEEVGIQIKELFHSRNSGGKHGKKK